MLAFGYAHQHRHEVQFLCGENVNTKIERRHFSLTFGTHTKVDRLDDIYKRLVLLVLDITTPPARGTRCLASDFRGLFLRHDYSYAMTRWSRYVLVQ